MVKSDDVFSVLQPTNRVGRVIGFASYKIISGPKTKRAKYEKIYNFVSMIIHSVMLIMLFIIYIADIPSMKTKGVMMRTTWLFYVITHLVDLVINILADKIYKFRLIHLVNTLSKMEHEIITNGICLDYKKMKYLVPLLSSLNFIFAIGIFYGIIITWVMNKFPSYVDIIVTISFVFAVTQRAVFVGQFVSFVRIFVSMLHSIDVHLEKAFLQKSGDASTVSNMLDMLCLYQVRTLLKLSKFHETLAEMTKELNRIVSVQMVVLFFCDFCVQTMQGFSCANNVFNADTFHITTLVFSMSDILSTFVKLIVMTRSVNLYMNEVNNV